MNDSASIFFICKNVYDENNIISGDYGNDVLNGLNGDDIITGGFGDDQLFGGSGNDTLTGGNGQDILTGGSGNDLLVLSGTDKAYAGSGDDTIEIQDGDFEFIDGGDGIDTLRVLGAVTSIDWGLVQNIEIIEYIPLEKPITTLLAPNQRLDVFCKTICSHSLLDGDTLHEAY